MDKVFGLRAVSTPDEGMIATAKSDRSESVGSDSRLVLDDLRVWDARSPHSALLEGTARRLLDAYAWLRDRASRWAKDDRRSRQWIRSAASSPDGRPTEQSGGGVDELKRTFVRIITDLDRALPKPPAGDRGGPSSTQRSSLTGTAVRSGVDGVDSNEKRRELKTLRKRLTVMYDRLRATEKERRDLSDVVRRNPPDRATTDSLKAALAKQKEKNAHLQAIVDEMSAIQAAHQRRQLLE